jgi:hypothetical protein
LVAIANGYQKLMDIARRLEPRHGGAGGGEGGDRRGER